MLEIKINGKEADVGVEGDLKTICEDTGKAICAIHDALNQSCPSAARKFRSVITALINASDSAVWAPLRCSERTMIDLSDRKRGEGLD